jgi:glycosyltransferase involved in cell wall biosynthesis
VDPGYRYSGEHAKGLVVVNHIARRGRRLGFDIYGEMKRAVPLDLIGMGAEEAGGLGEVRHDRLAAFAGAYRFFFNPIRYTSMGLAVIEAMMAGLPIVALATTEMVTVIKDGVNGFISTDLDYLARRMGELLRDREMARQLGLEARRTALARFGIERFAADWDAALSRACAPGRGDNVGEALIARPPAELAARAR